MNLILTLTDRQRHQLEPGSAEWLAHRAQQYNAGDAAAMLGCGYDSRTELLDKMVMGFERDVSWFQQQVFDAGHQVEALARPLAERIMGEDLFPFVYSAACEGLQRRLGASVDGAPFARTARMHWECKTLNDELRAALRYSGQADIAANDAKRLPKKYRVQMCQQAMVRDSDAVLFTAAQFSSTGQLLDERHAWYEPEAELCEEILRGWVQFEQDLAGHKPVVHAERARGERVESMGLPVVRVMGSVVESNLPQWRQLAFARIEAINRELTTDAHFGQAKEDVKWCEDSAKTIKQLKADVLGQMTTVNEVVTTLDEIVAKLDRTRLDLGKLVASREVEIRQEVAAQYEREAQEHAQRMVERLRQAGAPEPGRVMPALAHSTVAANFAGVMKGKRTIKSLHDACHAELARVKIALSAVADRIEANVRHFGAACGEWKHLFPAGELNALLLKEHDDFKAITANRIAEAQRAEQERRDREERERQEREARAAAAQATRDAQAAAAAAAPTPAPTARPAVVTHTTMPGFGTGASMRPAAEPDPFEPAPAGQPTLKLGTINAELGFVCTSTFLEGLGFVGVRGERNAILYHASDWPRICQAIASRCLELARQPAPVTTPAATA